MLLEDFYNILTTAGRHRRRRHERQFRDPEYYGVIPITTTRTCEGGWSGSIPNPLVQSRTQIGGPGPCQLGPVCIFLRAVQRFGDRQHGPNLEDRSALYFSVIAHLAALMKMMKPTIVRVNHY